MFGAILAGASIISSIAGARSSSKARNKAKSAEALEASRAAIINIQNRRAAAASVRRQEGAQRAAAIATGMGGGSSDYATASSLRAQGLSEVGKAAQQEELGAGVNELLSQSNKYSNQAQNWQSFGKILGSAGSFASALSASVTPTTPTLPQPPL